MVELLHGGVDSRAEVRSVPRGDGIGADQFDLVLEPDLFRPDQFEVRGGLVGFFDAFLENNQAVGLGLLETFAGFAKTAGSSAKTMSSA